VWEWVTDWYDADIYAQLPRENPQGSVSGQNRVLRGGSWNFAADLLRVANRYWSMPDAGNVYFGFRCAR
jgi:formylglycine-generating enzyme required for sulfatase activity